MQVLKRVAGVVLVLTGLSFAPTLARDPTINPDDFSKLAYSPWQKLCTLEPRTRAPVCITRKEGRAPAGQRVTAAVFQRSAEPPILQVMLPLGIRIINGMRVAVDDTALEHGGPMHCMSDGCITTFQLTSEVLDSLKKGHILVIVASTLERAEITPTLSLVDFAAANGRQSLDGVWLPTGKSGGGTRRLLHDDTLEPRYRTDGSGGSSF